MADDGRGGEQAERQRRLAALRDLTQQPGQAAGQISHSSAAPAQGDTLKRPRVVALAAIDEADATLTLWRAE